MICGFRPRRALEEEEKLFSLVVLFRETGRRRREYFCIQSGGCRLDCRPLLRIASSLSCCLEFCISAQPAGEVREVIGAGVERRKSKAAWLMSLAARWGRDPADSNREIPSARMCAPIIVRDSAKPSITTAIPRLPKSCSIHPQETMRIRKSRLFSPVALPYFTQLNGVESGS